MSAHSERRVHAQLSIKVKSGSSLSSDCQSGGGIEIIYNFIYFQCITKKKYCRTGVVTKRVQATFYDPTIHATLTNIVQNEINQIQYKCGCRESMPIVSYLY